MKIYRFVAVVVALLSAPPTLAQQPSDDPSPSSEAWIVANDGQVVHWTYTYGFRLLSGNLKQVAIGTDGTVWGLLLDGSLASWTSTGWKPGFPARLKQFAVRTSKEIWGVNDAGDLYRSNASSSGWNWEIMGKYDSVSVGSDGAVWALNTAGDPFRRDGSTWTPMPKPPGYFFIKLRVTDAQHVIGETHTGEYFQWTGTNWQPLNWCQGCPDIVLAADGRLWGLSPKALHASKAVPGGGYRGNQWEVPLDQSLPEFMQFAMNLAGPPTISGSGMTLEQEQGVLRAHNAERERYPVAPLQWSPELAAFAREWAQRVEQAGKNPADHRPAADLRSLNPLASGVLLGENIAWGWPMDLPDVLTQYVDESWVGEKQYYHYDRDDGFGYSRPPGCDQNKVCGHFTQVIWKGTQYVGCGLAVTAASQEAWMVCNYHPAGNIPRQKPY